MPVPPLEEWRRALRNEGAQRLGVRPVEARAEGWARFVIDTPFGDERDGDEDFLHAALAYAVDVAALAADLARVDPDREQPNGTAARVHLNVVGTPSRRRHRRGPRRALGNPRRPPRNRG